MRDLLERCYLHNGWYYDDVLGMNDVPEGSYLRVGQVNIARKELLCHDFAVAQLPKRLDSIALQVGTYGPR